MTDRPRVTPLVYGDRRLGLIVHAGPAPGVTTFVSDPGDPLQVGFVVHPAGHVIAPHVHRPVARSFTGTPEVLLVQQGRCHLDLFDETDGSPLDTVALGPGDIVVLLGGGHGFRMDEDTVLLEVKQGPYGGLDEKRPL